MKPLRLTIEGINSFTEPREIDFEKLSKNGIFCICGPTGSGKTTILDSIIIALYAPSIHHRGSLKDYINTKCDKGKITLDFEEKGKRYSVYRELRSSASSRGTLRCLDTGEVLADSADGVTAEIGKMLHLSKDEFTKVVVLEQGRFADFMTLTRKKRNDVVSKLFSLERFDKLKETVSKAKTKYESEIGKARAALDQYSDVTEKLFDEKSREEKKLAKEKEEKSKSCAALENGVLESERRREAAARRVEAEKKKREAEAEKAKALALREDLAEKTKKLEEEKQTLSELKERSENANAVLRLAGECEADENKCRELGERRDKLRAGYTEIAAALNCVKEKIEAQIAEKERQSAIVASSMRDIVRAGYAAETGSEAEFSAVKATAQADCAKLAENETKVKKLIEETERQYTVSEKFLTAKNMWENEAKKAAKELKAAEEAYERARVKGAVSSVRASLSDGDRCPVCGGVYRGEHADPDKSNETIASAKAKTEECAAKLENAEKALKEAEINLADAEAKLRELRKSLEEAKENAKGNTEASRAAATSAETGMKAAKIVAECELQTEKLRGAEKDRARELERITEDGKRLKEEIESITARIRERMGGASVSEAKEAAQRDVSVYESARKSYDDKMNSIATERERLCASEAAASAAIAAQESILASSSGENFDEKAYAEQKEKLLRTKDEVSSLTALLGTVDAEKKAMREKLDKKKELTETKRKLESTLAGVNRLFECVKSENPLLSYIAEEYVQAFTASASDTLHSLTAGKYELVYDGDDFLVKDFLAENALRKVKTLSGGETFLASMSIAIAISREIASESYEFFFLDEGFGTLHERALRTVTDALMELGKSTTVGIITHRSELAAEISARLDVIPATEDSGSDLVTSV